jgi:hypothetical protein
VSGGFLMKMYTFSLEYDGRKTVKKADNDHTVIIRANDIREAIRVFEHKMKLKPIGVNLLMNSENYRAFFTEKNRIIGLKKEFIYLISEIADNRKKEIEMA